MSRPFEGSYMGDGSRIEDDTRLECGICWWVYDPALGDEETQTLPGTPFRLLNDTWTCPNCAAICPSRFARTALIRSSSC
jgi:rubredoxin